MLGVNRYLAFKKKFKLLSGKAQLVVLHPRDRNHERALGDAAFSSMIFCSYVKDIIIETVRLIRESYYLATRDSETRNDFFNVALHVYF